MKAEEYLSGFKQIIQSDVTITDIETDNLRKLMDDHHFTKYNLDLEELSVFLKVVKYIFSRNWQRGDDLNNQDREFGTMHDLIVEIKEHDLPILISFNQQDYKFRSNYWSKSIRQELINSFGLLGEESINPGPSKKPLKQRNSYLRSSIKGFMKYLKEEIDMEENDCEHLSAAIIAFVDTDWSPYDKDGDRKWKKRSERSYYKSKIRILFEENKKNINHKKMQ